MQNAPYPPHDAPQTDAAPLAPDGARRRPRPGERREQILQTLAAMLEQPAGDRITTAALAARLQVSEAALYRHFASKAQMFEGLIDFIEHTLFAGFHSIVQLDAAVVGQGGEAAAQAKRMVALVLEFAERNPGLARVMVGDALVLEHERLQQRMNLLFDKMESAFKQCLRDGALCAASDTPTVDVQVCASVLAAFVSGRLQRYVRSGYRRLPSEHLQAALRQIMG